ncbi:MAG: hypothetical protein RSB39_07965 [Oscillospiraceae bacterium]
MQVILIGIALWIITWLFVIVLNIILKISLTKKAAKNNEEWENSVFSALYERYCAELVADGNSMFSAGFMYMIGTLICKFVQIPILQWAVVIILACCCIKPLISGLFTMIPQAFKTKFIGTTLIAISGLTCTLAQIGMVANMAFAFLK